MTLVLEPGEGLTWGILDKAMFALPVFMDWFGYVGVSFQIGGLGSEVFGVGHVIGGFG